MTDGWRCYHCGKLFTDDVLAAEHFGEPNRPRPSQCQKMLEAIADEFERYGIHRNLHNAASVKLLVEKYSGKPAYEVLEALKSSRESCE